MSETPGMGTPGAGSRGRPGTPVPRAAWPGPARGRMRASDAERDTVITELGSHLASGRLDSEEFGQRLDAAASAQFRDDLDQLLADLPRAAQARQAPARQRQHWPAARSAALVMIAVLALVAVTAGSALSARHGRGHWGMFWWLIPAFIFLFRRLLWHQRAGRGGRG